MLKDMRVFITILPIPAVEPGKMATSYTIVLPNVFSIMEQSGDNNDIISIKLPSKVF